MLPRSRRQLQADVAQHAAVLPYELRQLLLLFGRLPWRGSRVYENETASRVARNGLQLRDERMQGKHGRRENEPRTGAGGTAAGGRSLRLLQQDRRRDCTVLLPYNHDRARAKGRRHRNSKPHTGQRAGNGHDGLQHGQHTPPLPARVLRAEGRLQACVRRPDGKQHTQRLAQAQHSEHAHIGNNDALRAGHAATAPPAGNTGERRRHTLGTAHDIRSAAARGGPRAAASIRIHFHEEAKAADAHRAHAAKTYERALKDIATLHLQRAQQPHGKDRQGRCRRTDGAGKAHPGQPEHVG